MRQSQLFGQTRKEGPQGEESKNAILLQRGGYIDKTMAGAYSFLPLGLRVMKNVSRIVREEMDKLPYTQETLMPALQPRELWEETGRWALYTGQGEVYTVENDSLMLGPTHEEVVTDLFRKHVSSYRQLPVAVYQIQTKFRKELRAKSGLLRGREFPMKDLYSFHLSETDLLDYYEQVAAAYAAIYQRVGLNALRTKASGGSFSTFSDEFQVITPAGEDTIYLRADGKEARNKELISDETDLELLAYCGGTIQTAKAVEVGNIFPLGMRYSEPMKAAVANEEGQQQDVWMGCYGIGISRLIGAVVEVHGNDSGAINWPEELAPFSMHLIDLTPDKQGMRTYTHLQEQALSVLYDDRDKTAGEKFADADLIGAPIRVVISKRSLVAGGAEVRQKGTVQIIPLEDLSKLI